MKHWRTTIVLAVTSLIGVAAFLSPFWLARTQTIGADRTAHGGDAPLLFAIIGVLCLVVLLIETGGGADPDAKRVALLGVLVAANAALRLIPGIFGASPIFFLPICVGFVWGPSFGFLLGAASIAVSGLLTGGIGPWLPFQMMTLGWVGLTAGVMGALTPRPPSPTGEGGDGTAAQRHASRHSVLSPQSSVLDRACDLRCAVGLPLWGDHESLVLAVRGACVAGGERVVLGAGAGRRRDGAAVSRFLWGDLRRL